MKAKPDAAEPAEIQVMPRVGVIEDEPYVRTIIETYLSANRFIVRSLRSGQEVQQAVAKGEIDLLLLDLGLPGEDGISILHAVRTVSRLPVVIVSGRKETVSIAAGLDAGADDYVTKPIAFEELGARVRSVLRRSQQGAAKLAPETRFLRLHNARIDLESRRVTGPKGEAMLTEREGLILSLLYQAGGQPVSRTMLTRATKGQSWDFSIRTLDVHISNIRAKLVAVGVPASTVLTARNLGYRLSPHALNDEPQEN